MGATDQMCFIASGIDCMIVDSKRRLKDYKTKKQNVFPTDDIVYGSGIVFSMKLAPSGARININASMLRESGYITFRTGDHDWPYIVFAKSLFTKLPERP